MAHTIGCNLKRLRQKKFPGHGGAKKCAEQFGVAAQAWSQWERGVKMPNDINQRKLALFFGVSVVAIRGEQHAVADPAAMERERHIRDAVNHILLAQKSLSELAHLLLEDDFAIGPDQANLVERLRRLRDALSHL
ncbi:MAG: helix-turn-helix domain-containing protein [Planctomycetes bacterium]|nr:helix-turn-helix domain-containing protein [Planctomycetota bacterium]